LIVDDFPDYAGLLENQLQLEGFRTLMAYDGETAIQKARSEKPDLIILDIMMPDLGGTEVRIELLKDPATKDIPVIFLTGLRAPRSKRKALTPGVRTLGKSGDFNELLEAVREALGKSEKTQD
jgi:DNA-binding response OmpR family regulator